MKSLSVFLLTPFFLWLWLSGGLPDPCQAQRLTSPGRASTAAAPLVRLLKLPLSQKVDSVVHHLRTYPQATPGQQRRYAHELAVHFAPSGYISVQQAGQPETRLSVTDYLTRFGRQSAGFRFGGAEVVYYGQSTETAAGNRQMAVTTYRNAVTFSGNKPQAPDLTTVMIPVENPAPAVNYWQIFNLYLIATHTAAHR